MDKIKALELQIAVSMDCHCAIGTVNHLSKIMTAHGHRSILEHIKLCRNKCACLIKSIIKPALKTDLLMMTFETRNMPSPKMNLLTFQHKTLVCVT
jgi:hypothetical protein